MERDPGIRRLQVCRAAVLAVPLFYTPAFATTYQLTDLGSLGGNTTEAVGITSSGEIAGDSMDSTGTFYPFTWSNGKMTSLGTFNGQSAFARCINNFGEVGGNLSNADIFTYSNGQFTDVGLPLGGTKCRANGINDLGEVTGQLTLPGPVARGFLYNPATGNSTNIGTMSGNASDFSYGSSVNNLGQIEGDSINSNNLDHAYIWTNGSFNDLGTLGGADSSGVDVNNEGHAVGTAELNDTGLGHTVFHPFLYDGTTMHDLGTLGGNYGNSGAVNDFDVVVGYTYLSDNVTSNAFIYSNGVMTNLNSLIPANTGCTLTSATGINDSGEIVADGYNAMGQHAAFLLTPTANFLTWDAIGPSGDGVTWDTSSQNWNNGSPAIFANQLNVIFNNSNAGPASYHVTLNTTVTPGSVTVNNIMGNYTIGGTGSIAGPAALFKSGSGSLTLNTANSYSGGTFVGGGTVVAGVSGALPFGAIVLTSGGSVQLAASTGLTELTTLSISGSGTFDVNNNHVIINYDAGVDPISSIAAFIATGYAGGVWNGAGGIISSAAQSNHQYGLGFADSADTGNPAGLAPGTIEIAYTLLGDVNLDGVVNGIDFGILAANFNKSVTSWDQGDFDYDHAVNGIDFGELAANFNRGASGASAYEMLDSFAAANGLLADLPEPGCASLGAAVAIPVLRRRRKVRAS